ncbi:MAG: DUF4870 domain-containing protein [Halobacteriota archaeon]|nr:DUF4870 domain-containing protein [Halobacteriota archaeon]
MSNTSIFGLDENIAAALSYLLGWLSGFLVLFLESDNEFVRFHAKQSIVVFLGLTVIGFIIGAIPIIGFVTAPFIGLLSVLLWLLLMWRAYQGARYKLPIAGDFAESLLR